MFSHESACIRTWRKRIQCPPPQLIGRGHGRAGRRGQISLVFSKAQRRGHSRQTPCRLCACVQTKCRHGGRERTARSLFPAPAQRLVQTGLAVVRWRSDCAGLRRVVFYIFSDHHAQPARHYISLALQVMRLCSFVFNCVLFVFPMISQIRNDIFKTLRTFAKTLVESN